ncbi:ArsA-related P-loop ATPase [Gordonia aichiensis]
MVFGPGGSGVTAVAAAGAVSRTRTRRPEVPSPLAADRHTLLVTIDRLSPVPDILGVFRSPNEVVAVSAHLHLLCLERLTSATTSWALFAELLADTARRSKIALPFVDTLAGIDQAEVTSLPGIEDALLLRRIRDEAVSGQWQRIVVDLSGAGDPYAILDAPSMLRHTLDRLWPRHRRLAAAADRPAVAQLTTAIDAIDRDCADVADLLSDASITAAHLVLGSGHRGARLLSHHLAAIDLLGLPLRSINLDDALAESGRRELRAEEIDVAPGVDVRCVTALDVPLDRPARLRKLGVTLPAPSGRAHGSSALTVVGDAADGVEATYELAWPQTLPDPERFMLGRSGDDLLVTVEGMRHCLPLPSVLRRCVVDDADWDGERVRIRFSPDPAVWPRR